MRGRSGRAPAAATAVAGAMVGILTVGLLLPNLLDGQEEAAVTSTPGAAGAATRPGAPAGGGAEPAADDPQAATGAALPGGGPTSAADPGVTADGGGAAAAPGAARPTEAAAAGSGGGPARTASDTGVTPEEIKLGVILLDLSTANSVGLAPDHYEVETQRKAYEAQVDALNRAGGLHGRRTRTVYAVADPFDAQSALAACVKLTEDEKVFAVIAFAGYTADGMLCVGRQHRTPIIVFGWPPTEHFRLTEGRLVSDGMAGNRIMFNWVDELHRRNLLDGRTIGVVSSESTSNGDKQAAEQGLLPALRQYGYEVAYRARLSESLPTAASQIPSQVAQMRSAGVDFVFLPVSFLYATQWVQAAHGQGWRPGYTVSDLQGLTSDVVLENMPSSFEGAWGFTDSHFVRRAREGMAEPAIDRTCRETYNRATGERWRWGDRHPLFNACVQVEIYRRTMLGAGPNPTRATWVAGVRGVGSFPLATKFPGGFSGRNDYGGSLSTIRWKNACRCFETIEGPRPARY